RALRRALRNLPTTTLATRCPSPRSQSTPRRTPSTRSRSQSPQASAPSTQPLPMRPGTRQC
ncbi:hypothetical protein GGF46_000926, partial [Coemansia sp. RSA 552]